MLDPEIVAFLDERKEAWLKKEIKSTTTDEERLCYQQEGAKKFALETWLPDAAKRAKQLYLVTHPSKFTHSGAKDTSAVIARNLSPIPGLLCSGNASLQEKFETDVTGNAAALDVYKFLSLKLQDGRTILSHLRENTPHIQEQFALESTSFTDLRTDLLKVEAQDKNIKTHGKLKQVYFPVTDDYHLLSVLTPSGIVFELKDRLQKLRFSEHTKTAREAKKKNLEHEDFNEIFDLTEIGFGGTKPQNVSVLNSQNYGRAYLLSSLPPTLKKQTRLPRKDFFRELLWYKHYQEGFSHFHKLLNLDINTVHIRDGRDYWINFIWDQVVQKAWMVRQEPEGWSSKESYSSLRNSQKIWLDNAHETERLSNQDWTLEIARDFIRWFLWAYQESFGTKAKTLGDDELKAFSHFVQTRKERFL